MFDFLADHNLPIALADHIGPPPAKTAQKAPK